MNYLRMYSALVASFLALMTFQPLASFGHGFEGDRFFPPTVTTNDPFAVDDFTETASVFKNPNSSDTPGREFDINTSVAKEIFPKFAISLAQTYSNFRPDGGPSYDGFKNLQIGAMYQAYENPEHEFVCTVGLNVDLGGSGSDHTTFAGTNIANSYTTYSPTIYYGKGFGDLGNELSALRPFAITGQISQSIPSEGIGQETLSWGGAIEYSLPYLTQNVSDIGLPEPFRNMIPVVEYTLQSNENHNAGGDYAPELTTGTINPGVLWETKYCQIGLEALIPINKATGPDVGAILSVDIFIDDIVPHVFGKPLFGGKE